jgi:hypothetical protein
LGFGVSFFKRSAKRGGLQMNDTGLLMLYSERLLNPLAWKLFDCLDKEERERLWKLLYDKSMQHYVEHIDDYISHSETKQIKQEVKK